MVRCEQGILSLFCIPLGARPKGESNFFVVNRVFVVIDET